MGRRTNWIMERPTFRRKMHIAPLCWMGFYCRVLLGVWSSNRFFLHTKNLCRHEYYRGILSSYHVLMRKRASRIPFRRRLLRKYLRDYIGGFVFVRSGYGNLYESERGVWLTLKMRARPRQHSGFGTFCILIISAVKNHRQVILWFTLFSWICEKKHSKNTN